MNKVALTPKEVFEVVAGIDINCDNTECVDCYLGVEFCRRLKFGENLPEEEGKT